MVKRKLKIGVLFGGRSTEHEVSLVSAASVMANLNRSKYEVIPIGITRNGTWLYGPKAHKLLTQRKHIPSSLRAILPPEPLIHGIGPLARPMSRIKALDAIFPVLHGTFGEDGAIQGFLELTGIPYVGSGVLGSATGMDKVVQKLLFQRLDIPTAKFVYISSTDYFKNTNDFIKLVTKQIGFPCFIKPPNLGSSVGISKAKNIRELKLGIHYALKFDRTVMVEKGIIDAWEIECAVLGNNNPVASMGGRIISSNEFYDYDAKYIDGKSQTVIPANISHMMMRKIQDISKKAFKILDLAGMARVDFLVQPKLRKIYLNEVNTIPGFTSISMYPKLWEASGMTYTKLLDKLINLALERGQVRKKLLTSYRPRKQWYRK